MKQKKNHMKVDNQLFRCNSNCLYTALCIVVPLFPASARLVQRPIILIIILLPFKKKKKDVTVIRTTGLEFLMRRDLEIDIEHTGMSLSMVLGIPAIDTFRPRRLTSCTITKICSECLAPILKRCQE
jgi:hypothetical protein